MLSHLHLVEHLPAVPAEANCSTSLLSYSTCQFLTRAPGDRPQVIPEGSTNFAFLSQFAEMPGNVVSTVEYSVRSAQLAVYQLLKLDKELPALYNALKTMHR